MGTSTNGMLVYGYIWDDEYDVLENARDNEGDERDWSDIIADKRGLVNPWDAYPPEIEALPYSKRGDAGEAWVAENRAAIDAYFAVKKAIVDEYGIEIEYHGSDEWSVPIVCIAGATVTAHRGNPKPIDPASLTVDPTWDEKLARFCADLGIDTSDAAGPGWFLASWWG